MHTKLRIILGSSSVQRQHVLRAAGVPFDVMSADINEKAIRDDDPLALTLAIATAKRDALLLQLKEHHDHGNRVDCVLITVDQVVLYRGRIREKPVDATEARTWLMEYGRGHGPIRFVTSVVFTRVIEGQLVLDAYLADVATMRLEPMDKEVVEQLIRTGKVLGVAGAFTIEDPLVKAHVLSLTNVMHDPEDAETSVLGLPHKQVIQALRDMGAIAD